MSTMQTPPPPDAPAPPERRCPRCGHAMAPDQEWCLACGAAASTEVAEPRGWRVPIMIAGGLALLAILGVVLALVALSGGGEKLAATPTPSPQAVPTTSPIPTATVSPLPTESAAPTETASPTDTATPEPSATPDEGGNTGSDTGSTFSGWPGGDGWTVIIASKGSQSEAETIATAAQGKGLTVGILNSDDFSSLNPGYQVVFTEKFDSKSAAEDSLSDVQSDYPDAYVREVSG